MNWLKAHWKAVTSITAALGVLAGVASAGAQVQEKLTQLDKAAELAGKNTATVAELVELHRREAEQEAHESEIQDLRAIIESLQQQLEETDGEPR